LQHCPGFLLTFEVVSIKRRKIFNPVLISLPTAQKPIRWQCSNEQKNAKEASMQKNGDLMCTNKTPYYP